MKKPKLTPWFKGTIKPDHEGVYERHTPMESTPTFQHWDGNEWGCAGYTPEYASAHLWKSGLQTQAKWRGLASDPSKAS